ncbi:hypothetical protein Y032_0005g2462 [Ancylostoma ceylanicum]|uniref:Uncharacterized protein n=2 Tax=Ancylostoma ceylanicum TaxID=53326 RepID=A0A016VRE3_9BILA|nr:hypothetical protein Y032_0005g2462 [Ancylostoma ceylanicum]
MLLNETSLAKILSAACFRCPGIPLVVEMRTDQVVRETYAHCSTQPKRRSSGMLSSSMKFLMRTHPDTSDRSRWLETSKDTPGRKISSSSVASTLSRLTSRLAINPTIRWTPASKINHDTPEGRTEFYNQVCHKLLKKSKPAWR